MVQRKTQTTQPVEESASMKRAEERAVADEASQMASASARLRALQTGGLRLLFSPVRNVTSEGTPMKTTFGAGQ